MSKKLDNKTNFRKCSPAFVLLLVLALTSTLIITAPLISGQTTIPKRVMDRTTVWVGPRPSGLNQEVLIQGGLRPAPIGYNMYPDQSQHNIYRNLNFTIQKPDKTYESIIKNSDDRSEVLFWYNCTQIGWYRVMLNFPGDDYSTSTSSSWLSWYVQPQPVPPLSKIDLIAYVDVTYPTLGLGQTQILYGWFQPPREMSGGLYYNVKYTITKPSGALITGVRDTDSPDTIYVSTKCDEIGKWTFKYQYDGDILHKAVTSETVSWNVQKDQVDVYSPDLPLPDYKWKFPISQEYHVWGQISGAWKGPSAGSVDGSMYSSFNPYTTAPNAPHIMWRTQLSKSSLMGGDLGNQAWNDGRADEIDPNGLWTIVSANGKLYWNRPETYTMDGQARGLHPVLYCYDMYTGEQLWRRDLPGTGSGGAPEIIMEQSAQWDPALQAPPTVMYNIILSTDGLWVVEPITGDTMYFSQSLKGKLYENFIYMTNYPSGNFTKWDLTTKAIVWTVQAPKDAVTGDTRYPSVYGENLATTMTSGLTTSDDKYKIWTWDLDNGRLLVNGTVIDGVVYGSTGNYIIQDHKTFYLGADRRTYAIDVTTGKLAWKSEPADAPWGAFGIYYQAYSWGPNGGGHNQIYMATYDGYVHVYETGTGKELWKAYTTDTYEQGTGSMTPWAAMVIADNKLFYGSGQHTDSQPMSKDGKLFAVNAENGNPIWTLDGFYGRTGDRQTAHLAGASGGQLWYYNGYDGYLYMFGKGDTETTISTSTKIVSQGSSVLLEGAVTDHSPGATGTPAISDASMSQWMEYVYLQKPKPNNATGVKVHLTTTDPNGNWQDIGTATSNALGNYAITWKPPVPGLYTVTATFEGSESYWESQAGTSFVVTEATVPTPVVNPTPPGQTTAPTSPPTQGTTPSPTSAIPPTSATPTTTYVAISVAIVVIIIAAAAVILRRRK